MKNAKLFAAAFLAILLINFSSCKKSDNPDPRDQYVGSWNYTQSGSFTFYQNGQSVGTEPINASGSFVISKSGAMDLLIGKERFTVTGTHIAADPAAYVSTNNGLSLVGTGIDNGTLGVNLITVNSSLTGTWSNSNGATGNFSGTATAILTK